MTRTKSPRRQKGGVFTIGGTRFTARFSELNDSYVVRREGQAAVLGNINREGHNWFISGKRTRFTSLNEAVTSMVKVAC